MSDVTVTIDASDLRRAATAFQTDLAARVQRATKAEAEATRERITGGLYWTNRTGRLAKSFKVEQDAEGLGATLRSGSKVAVFIEAGTKPHAIAPRRAGALRFAVAGRTTFARSVRHPGTKARPYLGPESAAAEPRLLASCESATDAAIRAADLD